MRRGLLLALVLVLALPASALAHATLEATTPARGAVARAEPAQVVLRFDEAVEGNFGAVRVFDARGARVDDGPVVHPGGTGALLAVGLKPGLSDGSFTATYRVISADGHPVSGGFVFAIGHAGAAPAATVGDQLDGTSAGPVTQAAFGLARGADYLAIALVVGTLLFGLLAWRRDAAGPAAEQAFARRSRTVLAAGLGMGAAAGVAGIVLQGATAGGTSFWAALDPGVVREVLGTRFGAVWGLRLADLVLLGGALLVFGPRRPGAWALPAALLAITPALGGHAATQHPVALLVPLDVAHVVAMSVWVGGLVVLLVAVPAATRALDPPARAVLLGATVTRFSTIALASVATLLLTGTVQSIVHLRAFDDLLHTAFGRAVLIKVGLVLALIALGAVNRRRSVPRLRALAREGHAPGAAGRLLRRTLRAEIALAVVVLGVTAALVSYAPPSALSAGPFSHSTRTGPLEVEATVDPARTGVNAVHVYLFRASDGAPFTGTKELTVTASLPRKGIGPLSATVHRAGPGHYVADAMTLAPAGAWRLLVTDRVSDFDQYTATFSVPVR
ncbi:MAG: copper resistance protein CopC [Conexibacter sp.]|nr:copper resistance protein CopC [Conexibacter sp.]